MVSKILTPAITVSSFQISPYAAGRFLFSQVFSRAVRARMRPRGIKSIETCLTGCKKNRQRASPTPAPSSCLFKKRILKAMGCGIAGISIILAYELHKQFTSGRQRPESRYSTKGGRLMKEIKKILFPVDLSETSEKIVPYVQTMAEKFNAEIHLLFVARMMDYFVSIYVPHPSIDQFVGEVTEGAKKRLMEFTGEHFSKYNVAEPCVITGDASDEIIRYCESREIDLLIMGTHGRKGLDKVIFGSVADRVSKMATVPVLLINPYRVAGLK
jgi:nucleotide-binding universal stress UspA family protein